MYGRQLGLTRLLAVAVWMSPAHMNFGNGCTSSSSFYFGAGLGTRWAYLGHTRCGGPWSHLPSPLHLSLGHTAGIPGAYLLRQSSVLSPELGVAAPSGARRLWLESHVEASIVMLLASMPPCDGCNGHGHSLNDPVVPAADDERRQADLPRCEGMVYTVRP